MTIFFTLSLLSFLSLIWLIHEPLREVRTKKEKFTEKIQIVAVLSPFITHTKQAISFVFVTMRGYLAPLLRLLFYKGGELIHRALVKTASFFSHSAARMRGRGVVRKDLSPSHFLREIIDHHQEMRAQVDGR